VSDIVAELLRRLEQKLSEAGVDVGAALAPGLAEDSVRSMLQGRGMEPPEELVSWYTWHNGLTSANPDNGEGRLLLWEPYSLNRALEEWSRQDRGDAVWQWHPTWLPIARTGGAARMAVDCTPPQGPLATVRLAEPEAGLFDETQIASVTGLHTIVQWWIDALATGAYQFDVDAKGWDSPRWSDIPEERRVTGLV
jgi:hypothetical protein